MYNVPIMYNVLLLHQHHIVLNSYQPFLNITQIFKMFYSKVEWYGLKH